MSLEVTSTHEVREMVTEKVLQYITVFIGEFLASAFLMFVGCLGSVDNSPYFTPTGVSICLTWGVAVMIGINSFGVVSGGFMTPIITLAAFLHKIIDLPIALICFAAEIIGSFFGYAILRQIIPNDFLSNPEEFCLVKPNLSVQSAFVMEFIICFIFITFLCAIIDPRNSKWQDSAPIKFGLLVFVLLLTAGPYSGGGLNPARVFAPALYNFNWKNHWIYWITSTTGSVTSSLLYKHVFLRDFTKKSHPDLEEINIMK